jgi:hypothetical protein
MDIDAIQQWARDALLVARDGGGRAGTLAHRVGRVAAGALVRVTIA